MKRRIPRLLAISDLASTGGASHRDLENSRSAPKGAPHAGLASELDAWLVLLGRHGVDALQMREKALTDGQLMTLAARAVTSAPQMTVLVNGRVDIALAAGASGVHLPAVGVPVTRIRRHWGDRLLIGCSTHHLEEVRLARDDGADFVTYGPVFDTPSKRRYGKPKGLKELQRAANLGLPVIALGGVDASNMSAVAAAGAWGVAGIRAFQNPESLVEMARLAQRLWAP